VYHFFPSRRQSPSKVERRTDVQGALTPGDADIPHTLPAPPGGPGTSLIPVAPLTRQDYLYPIEKLPIKRKINLNVPVNEFYDMAYMAEGSNSHIFSANWKGKIVVVKIIQEEKMNNAIALDEFRIEKELLIRLDHPNVIEILGAGDAGTFHILLYFFSFSSVRQSYFQTLFSYPGNLFHLNPQAHQKCLDRFSFSRDC